MTDRIKHGTLEIAPVLHDLVVNRIIPGTGVDAGKFWSELEKIATDLMPKNKALLAKHGPTAEHRKSFKPVMASRPRAMGIEE